MVACKKNKILKQIQAFVTFIKGRFYFFDEIIFF